MELRFDPNINQSDETDSQVINASEQIKPDAIHIPDDFDPKNPDNSTSYYNVANCDLENQESTANENPTFQQPSEKPQIFPGTHTDDQAAYENFKYGILNPESLSLKDDNNANGDEQDAYYIGPDTS